MNVHTWELTSEQHPGSITRESPQAVNLESSRLFLTSFGATTTRLVVQKGFAVRLFMGTNVTPGGKSCKYTEVDSGYLYMIPISN